MFAQQIVRWTADCDYLVPFLAGEMTADDIRDYGLKFLLRPGVRSALARVARRRLLLRLEVNVLLVATTF